MNTVRSLFGHNKVDGDVGIEIETEAALPYDVPRIKGWEAKRDGSLRDFGIEYITNGPIASKNIQSHLSQWKDGLGDIHARLNPNSISTSVHVHVNIQEHTALELLNFYLVSVALENLLSKFAGPDREGNLFCLRTSDAEMNLRMIKQQLAVSNTDIEIVRAFGAVGDNRYANINPVCIRTFGSLEFRIMRGTTDTNEMKLWADTLVSIRDFTKQFKDPKDVLLRIKEKGVESFTKEALGTHGKAFMIPDYEKLVLPNLGYLAQIATSRKDWDIKAREIPVKRKPLPIQRQGRDDHGIVVVQWDEQFEVVDM